MFSGGSFGSPALEYVFLFIRSWGAFTTLLTWGVAVETAIDGFIMAILFFASGMFLTLFEVYLPLHMRFQDMMNQEHWWHKLWQSVGFMDNGILKFVVYLMLGAASCADPKRVWLGLLSGIFTIILAVLYLFKFYRDRVKRLASSSHYSRFGNRSAAAREMTLREGTGASNEVSHVQLDSATVNA